MKVYLWLCFLIFLPRYFFAQIPAESGEIGFSAKQLSVNEPLAISLILRDSEQRPSVIFPNIEGLQKASKSATSAVNIVDGRKVVTQTITQEYFASKEGAYIIPEFTLSVNTLKIKSSQTTIIFKAQDSTTEEPASADEDALTQLVDINQDIFFSVQPGKRSVYIREGFSLRMSLFVAEDEPVEMEFFRLTEQLQKLLKQVRPVGCWEENTGIEEIVNRKVVINGKKYSEYIMYQGELFPLTLGDIVLPSVSLDMIQVERGEGAAEKKVVRSFRSRGTIIKVLPLPPHPNKDQVSVGVYRLVEQLSKDKVYPGESIRYIFKVEGQGNIAAIPNPEVQPNASFDIYPPEMSQIVKRSSNGVSGEKGFEYFIVPRKDGDFPLSFYFQWIYFNTEKMSYDTLRSGKILKVEGEDYKLGNLSLGRTLNLYDNLEQLDSTKSSFNYRALIKFAINGIVLLLLIVMVWVFRK